MALSIFGRFFGNAVSTSAGVGIGGATQRSLDPLLQGLVNETWPLHAVVPPDAYALANGVAQGQVEHDAAYSWAKQQGFGTAQMDALVAIADTGPAFGELLQGYRRGVLSRAQFDTGLKRLAIEEQWWPMLRGLASARLDLGAIATAVHRGIMHSAGLLLQEPPTGAGNVEQIPVSDIDTIAEFAAHGIDAERARVLIADTGLPLALGQMLELLNRGVVTANDVQRAIAESNIRNEYMDVALALRRRLLTPHEYEEAALRGIITQDAADAGAAMSGMEKQDARLLFQIMGRPLTVHQITTGLERGGAYGGTYADVPEPYQDAIRRSNIRPEYARLAYANRYTLPSAFVIRGLVQSGAITADDAHTLFLQSGWPPELARKVADAYGAGTSASGGGHVKKAQTQLWSKTHTSYVNERVDAAAATAALTKAGVTAGEIPDVLATWDAERELVRAGLTPANIKKAYHATTLTLDEAVARLVELGWSVADANTYLPL